MKDNTLVKSKILSNGYQLATTHFIDCDDNHYYTLIALDTTIEDGPVDMVDCTEDLSSKSKKYINDQLNKELVKYSKMRSSKPGPRLNTIQEVLKFSDEYEEQVLLDEILYCIEHDLDPEED